MGPNSRQIADQSVWRVGPVYSFDLPIASGAVPDLGKLPWLHFVLVASPRSLQGGWLSEFQMAYWRLVRGVALMALVVGDLMVCNRDVGRVGDPTKTTVVVALYWVVVPPLYPYPVPEHSQTTLQMGM